MRYTRDGKKQLCSFSAETAVDSDAKKNKQLTFLKSPVGPKLIASSSFQPWSTLGPVASRVFKMEGRPRANPKNTH